MTSRTIGLVCAALSLAACSGSRAQKTIDPRAQQADELSALWSFYRTTFIEDGRVVAHDEDGITTSEGQSYALLRAVWADDPHTFRSVWRWTRANLQTRGEDKLFAWKWKDKVLDANSATDADVDIALALILASRRFDEDAYHDEALAILKDIWRLDVLHAGDRHYVTAGNWAPKERWVTLHVAYFAPYAYSVFAEEDPAHRWDALVKSSYEVLEWLYFDQRVRLPPELVFVDQKTGELRLSPPGGKPSTFGYDSVPLFWRLAVDERWFGRSEGPLRRRVLEAVEDEWAARQALLDRYDTAGKPLSELEGWPHAATAQSLAVVESPALAESIRKDRLDELFRKALAGEDTPYYLHNWLWFGRAFELDAIRHFEEPLAFLRPFDLASFTASFPWALALATLALAPFARRYRIVKLAFLAAAFAIAARYLVWRLLETLNFVELAGPVVSIGLWLAEFYSFSTVALLVLQVGTRRREEKKTPPMPAAPPSVDIYIPIYSEGLDILDKTLTAAAAIDYPNKRIWVCDDSHREAVAALAAEHGAGYIQGPKKHAKAGNLNNAISKTQGELLVVFDTDHLPVRTFLAETVPWFNDPKVGFLQTPHHFYNQDIFQRALRAGPKVPNEQDMFNHAIQGGRDTWGGSFFVGSGAVFRRCAIERLGGFKLMSITEDIHTSQHLHAAGWRSVFVDKDLAVGLTAENLAGYLIQRRRWMLGCLQIFFKDNPLFCRGLPLRHRIGYFASLYYFFYPLARVVFWVTPLLYLLFHWHPLFAEAPELLAYLIPYMVVLPMITRALLPGWPRAAWGNLYELAISFPLARSVVDLVLPLGFKVTPKGVVSTKRSFDFVSSRLTVIAAAITAVAIGKGLFEFHYFGIERDAYFINLGWALLNFVSLVAAVLIAWEAPQRRGEERLARALDVTLEGDGFSMRAKTVDVSLSGVALRVSHPVEFPRELTLRFAAGPEFRARLVYQEAAGGAYRCAFQYVEPAVESTRALVRVLFSDPAGWERAHDGRTRSAGVMLALFWTGLVRSLMPSKPRRRAAPRVRALRRLRCVHESGGRTVLRWDQSRGGLGLLAFGAPLPAGSVLAVLAPGQPVRWARVVHQTRRAPWLFKVGLQYVESKVQEEAVPDAYLAA